MSQQKIDHQYALIFQSTYQQIEVGILDHQQLITQINLDKTVASSQLLLAVDRLLQAQNCTLLELKFIGANLGPAPFTSLRVVVATVNGLGFATGVPLIGVNGLQAFVTECSPEPINSSVTLALLNAYNHDLYFGVLDQAGNFSSGWGKAEQVLADLSLQFQQAGIQKINLIGNGADLFREQILMHLSNFALSPELSLTAINPELVIPQYCSLSQVAKLAEQAVLTSTKQFVQLQPLYLKTVQTVVNKNYQI